MLWLTFRQHRGGLIATVAVLLCWGILLAFTAVEASLSDGSAESLTEIFQRVEPFIPWVNLLSPVAVGAFIGAPLLSREIETGTSEIAWSQSVTRRKWLTTKLLTLGLIVLILGCVAGLMLTGWLSIFHGLRLPGVSDGSFTSGRGILPGPTWLAGLMIGVAVGSLIPRAVPAMAATSLVVVVLVLTLNITMGPLTFGLEFWETQIVLSGLLLIGALLAIAVTWSQVREPSGPGHPGRLQRSSYTTT